MEYSNLDLFGVDTPNTERQTVIPAEISSGGSRKANDEARGRSYLTREQVYQLVKAARKNRHGLRDSTLILLAYQHGLRASEAVSLQWQQIDFDQDSVAVKRIKGSRSGTHPLQGDAKRALRKLQRETGRTRGFIFETERGGPMTVGGFQRMFNRLSEKALGVVWNTHALRHACGYHLISTGNDIRFIQQYLGHANIQNTVVYTAMSAAAFDGLAM